MAVTFAQTQQTYMSAFNVRVAETQDLSTLVRYQLQMATESEGITLNEQLLSKGMAAVLADCNKGFYLLAEDAAGKGAGMLMITYEWSDWRSRWVWWIQSVFVATEFRGQGVYSALYEAVQTRARAAKDVGMIRLYVYTANTKAKEMYEHLGMVGGHYEVYEGPAL